MKYIAKVRHELFKRLVIGVQAPDDLTHLLHYCAAGLSYLLQCLIFFIMMLGRFTHQCYLSEAGANVIVHFHPNASSLLLQSIYFFELYNFYVIPLSGNKPGKSGNE